MFDNLPRLVFSGLILIFAVAAQPFDAVAQNQPAAKDAETGKTGSGDARNEPGKNLNFVFFVDGEWWREGSWTNLPLFQNNNDTGLNLFNFDTDTFTPVPGLVIHFALPKILGPIAFDFTIRGFGTSRTQTFNPFTVPQGFNARLFPIDGSNFINLGNNFSNLKIKVDRHRVETGIGARGVLREAKWVDFMAVEELPDVLDFSGPAGRTYLRQAQIRYTHSFGGGTVAVFAIENPNIAHSTVTEIDYREHAVELETGIVVPRIFSGLNVSGLLDVSGGIVVIDSDLDARQSRGNLNFTAGDSDNKATYRIGSRLEFTLRPFKSFPGIGFGLRANVGYQGATPTVRFGRMTGERVRIGYAPRLTYGGGGFIDIPLPPY